MHIDPLVALAGAVVGFTVGLTGMGGGALMTPILVLLFKVQPLAAVSSDLVAAVIMKPVGGGVHLRRGTVNRRPRQRARPLAFRLSHRGEILEDLSGVGHGVLDPVGLPDHPLGIDQIGPTLGPLGHRLLGGPMRFVRLARRVIDVGQERKREGLELGELAISFGRVE
jgi:hypothetical protein